MNIDNWLTISGFLVTIGIFLLGILVESVKRKNQIKGLKVLIEGSLKHLTSLSKRHDLIQDILIGADVITVKDLNDVYKKMSEESREPVEELLKNLKLHGTNPITTDDVDKLIIYTNMDRKEFTLEEAEEFLKLAEDLNDEYPSDTTAEILNKATLIEAIIKKELKSKELEDSDNNNDKK
jgi:hypothetical protein